MWRRKLQISLRIGPALRTKLEEMAKRENRTFGNLATLLLEWGYEQLKAAGTTERLRERGLPFADKKAHRSRRRGPKTPMAPGVREDVWKGIKGIALSEDKNLSQLAELLLEWSVLQLSAAGSTDRLPKHQIRPVSRQIR